MFLMNESVKKILSLFLLTVFLSPHVKAYGFEAVKKGSPSAVISLGKTATLIEQFAASELSRYIKESTGADIPVKTSFSPSDRNVILIGRQETHPEVARLIKTGQLRLSPDHPGLDGFIIRTLSEGGRDYLVLGGSQDRGTLYAVYHFLETFMDVGFFWEGDVVPARENISTGTVNVAERPHYKNRFYMQECAFAYTTRGWNIEDWKREILWMSKKKLNMLMVPADNWNFRVAESEIITEAKKLGIKPVFGGELVRWEYVNKEFMMKNPGARYVKAHWWLDPPFHILHPGDPLFMERGRQHIRKLVEKYGGGNVYFISPYGEQTFMDVTAEEITEIRTSFARSVREILKAEDPEGTWTFWTWPFISPPWSSEDVKRFLQEVPQGNSAFVCDSSQPENPGDYHYKRFNYFEDRNWVLSFIHLYGGDDQMTGNLPQVIRDFKTLLADGRAKHCTGVYICPEIIHYNTVYFDLLTKLSWNPEDAKFEDYMKNYLLHRYGRDSYGNMNKAWQYLLDTVYGQTGGSQPVYQKRMNAPGSGMLGVYLTGALRDMRQSEIKTLPLKESLDYFLLEAETLKNNPCYMKDLVDVSRQYLTELFNLHYYSLNWCFSQNDREGFSSEKERLLLIMDNLEKILGTYSPYQIRPMVQELKDLPGFSSYEKIIKGPMYTFAGHWLLDYQSKDIYELVRYYYRPRLEFYLDELSRNFGKGIQDDNLTEGYKSIEDRWLNRPLAGLLGERYPEGDTVSAVREALAAAVTMEREKESGGGMPPAKEDVMEIGRAWDIKKAAWTEDFSDVTDWRITFFEGGSFTSNGKTAVISPPEEGKCIVFGTKLSSIPVRDFSVLTFRFKQHGWGTLKEAKSGTARFVVWVTWCDNKGRKLRNRIFQQERIPFYEWTDVSLNLLPILSVVSVPATVEMIEIESPVTVEWDNMQLGTMSDAQLVNTKNDSLPSGPTGYWTFDEGTGAEAKDRSGNNNHGKIFNSTYTGGIKGSALEFNGVDSRVEIPHSGKADLSEGFSFSLFVKTAPVEGGYAGRTIIGKPGSYLSPTIFASRAGDGVIFIVGAGKKSYQVQGSITPGQWHHLALSYDGKTLSGYIDGVKVGEKEVPESITVTGHPLMLGFSTAERAFKGVIDEVKFYNRALTAEEVRNESAPLTQQALSQNTESKEGLLGYYPLNETTGATAHDMSGNNKHAKLVGVIWKQGEGGSAAEFNGKDSYISIPHRTELNMEDAFTLEAMVNLSTVKGDQGFISKGRSYFASGYTFQQTDGRMKLYLATTVKPGKDVKGTGYQLSTESVMKAHEWTHVAATYDSASAKARIYKDGELQQEFAVSGKIMYLPPFDYPYDTLPVTLSGMAPFPHLYNQLDGFMREVKIYNRALTPEQIKQDYSEAKHVKTVRLKTEKELREEKLTCRLTISAIEKDSNKSLKAQVFIKDKGGGYYLPAESFSYGTEKFGYFYLLDESDTIKMPEGEFEITALHGFEYWPVKVVVALKGNDTKSVELSFQRFANMPEKKWFGGEHHIHAIGHGRRPYDEILGIGNAAKICEAVGMNYAVLMQDIGFETSSGNRFIAMGGREWTPSLGGHMCLVNIHRQPRADTTDFSNMQVIDDVLEQGGVAVYTHPTSGIDFASMGDITSSREMPVAVGLGKMPIWDVSYGGLYSFDNVLVSDWYRYLNLGFKLAAGASTDIYMNNHVNQRTPGFHRTYAKIESLSWPEIVDAYKKGRTFITSGPLLLLQVNGKDPGDTVYLDGKKTETVNVAIEASFLYGIDKVEIIKNGRVIDTVSGKNQEIIKTAVEIPVNETCWMAARVYGNRGEFFGTLAHTSPVYVQYGKEKIKVKGDDADYFVKWLEDYRTFIHEFCKYRKLDAGQAGTLLSDVERSIGIYRALKNN